MKEVLLKGGTVVTMNGLREVFVADLLIRGPHIAAIGSNLATRGSVEIVDAAGCFVIPGLIQAHTHLCQTLFRGLADDLELLDWLQKRIWPFEFAHDAKSLRASAELGLMEMQLLGTTSILDMASVRHTDSVFAAAEESGMRYWGGNCLMDMKATSGPLHMDTASTLKESERLLKTWHQKNELIRYAISPRFVISCTEKMLREAAAFQRLHGVILHTHASENKSEVALVRRRTGLGNVEYLRKMDLLNDRTVIAHGIHLSQREVRQMVSSKAGLTHCPSSNLKLASGFAPIQKYLDAGMKVALGSDGAPCNNTMDPFLEMRLAALLQKPLVGPTALSAPQAFELATLGGARVLGMEKEIGSLEVGKKADIVLVDRSHPSVATVDDPYSSLVYSVSGRDVRDVWIHGRRIVKNQSHQIFDQRTVTSVAKRELKRILLKVNSGRK